ncbi:MAG: ATP-binding protein [Candidatus Gastranaerophilales bacterium]
MKNIFIKTKNVKRLISLMDNLQKAPPNVPKMALVYGEYGLGKSQAIMWWVTNNDAIYVRCNHKISARWLLSEIVKELDEEPCYTSQHLFRQIEEKLKFNPKVIVVDEIDYLFSNTHTIETLRDIHDKLGVPILLVGMGLSNKKLLKYGHVNDRIYGKLKFEKICNEDFKEIIETLSEVNFCKDSIKYVATRNLQFRQIVKLISKAENLANTNKLDEITINITRRLIDEE